MKPAALQAPDWAALVDEYTEQRLSKAFKPKGVKQHLKFLEYIYEKYGLEGVLAGDSYAMGDLKYSHFSQHRRGRYIVAGMNILDQFRTWYKNRDKI